MFRDDGAMPYKFRPSDLGTPWSEELISKPGMKFPIGLPLIDLV